MECETNATVTNPSYAIFTTNSTSGADENGKPLEKKERVCKVIDGENVVIANNFEWETMLIQPFGPAWSNGAATIKILIFAEIEEKDDNGSSFSHELYMFSKYSEKHNTSTVERIYKLTIQSALQFNSIFPKWILGYVNLVKVKYGC